MSMTSMQLRVEQPAGANRVVALRLNCAVDVGQCGVCGLL
jgi:hypothetical protein